MQAALLELRGTLGRADELLKSGAQSAEIEPVLASARSDMSQIHIDVKDLSQTITIVEEVRPRCTAPVGFVAEPMGGRAALEWLWP